LVKYANQCTIHAQKLFFTANHDENSWNGTEYEKYGDTAMAFAVFTATWRGIPLIYSGQELPNKKRLRFFDKDEIEWIENCELHNFYKTLLELRSKNPALSSDKSVDTYLLKASDERVFCFLRKKGSNEVLVILNLSPGWLSFTIDSNNIAGNYKDVFSGEDIAINNNYLFHFSAWDYKVLEK